MSRAKLIAILLACAAASPAPAAEPQLPAGGWASWQVPAVDGAPAWCCSHSTCRLEGNRNGMSIHDDDTTTDAVTVYARVSAGKVDSLQVYSASCRVESATPIHDLGSVAPDDSARWLIERAHQDGTDAVVHRALAEGALTALAMHRGDLARDALAAFARSDSRVAARKWALFWLGIVRGAEAQSERVINDALRKDPDADVREQAVFALSRLPGDRATKALIATAEDRTLSKEQRKRAIFWLAQSGSDAAQSYLEKVLASNAAR